MGEFSLWHVLIILVVIFLPLSGIWKAFEKAGQPGWAAIVPIYNIVIMLKIGQLPSWYVLLLLIPLANIFVLFVMYNGISKNFGQGLGFTIGLFFLGIIFWPILGFGDATYTRIDAKEPAPSLNAQS